MLVPLAPAVDQGGACGSRGSRASLVSLNVPTGSAVLVRASSSTGSATLSVRRDCQDEASALAPSCVAAPAPMGLSAIVINRGPASGLTLQVDTLEASPAVVTLEVEVTPGRTDVCEGFPTLPLDARGLAVGVTDPGAFGVQVQSDGALTVSDAMDGPVTLEATSCGGSALEPASSGTYLVSPGRVVVRSQRPRVFTFGFSLAEVIGCGADDTLELPADGSVVVAQRRLPLASRVSPCTGRSGSERRYRLATPGPGFVDLRLIPDGAFAPSLWQTTDQCREAPTSCLPAGPVGVSRSVTLAMATRSTLIGVGSAPEEAVTVEARYRPLGANEACGSPGAVLTLPADGGAVELEQSLADSIDDVALTCSPDGLTDVYVPITVANLAPGERVRARFLRLDGGVAFLATGCAPRGCVGPVDERAELIVSNGSGQHSRGGGVWVSGARDLSFRLSAAVEQAPEGESCPFRFSDGGWSGLMAPPLPLDGGVVTMELNLSTATADLESSCAPRSPDLFVAVPVGARFRRPFVEVTARPVTPGVVAAISAGVTCGNSPNNENESCMVADDGGVARVRTLRGIGAPADRTMNFVHVQNRGSAGRVELSFRYDGTSLPTDTCDASPVVDLTNAGALDRVVDFNELGPDSFRGYSCTSNVTGLRDAFVLFSLSQPSRVAITLEALSPSLQATLALVTNNPPDTLCYEGTVDETFHSSAVELVCGTAALARPLALTTGRLGPGQYGIILLQRRGTGSARLGVRLLP